MATKLATLKARAKREGWLHQIRNASDEQALFEGCYYDQAAADRVGLFFRRFLRHSKGSHAGKPFELIDWQRENLIDPVFGWKRPNGMRRFTRVYCELPKKNGKSTIAAGIGLYMLCGDGEKGSKVFSAASDRDQAKIVHDEAVNMVDTSPALLRAIKINRSTNKLTYLKGRSEYSALSAAPRGKEGLDGHCAIIDELHIWSGRQLWDALRYMGRARRQPLIFVITTAGDDLESVCWEQHEYAQAILSSERTDTRYYPLIYACKADELEGDAILDREKWRRANPSIGHTIDEDEFGRDLAEAIASPRSKAAFLRYSFNIWSQSVTAWLDQRVWAKAKSPTVEDSMIGLSCHGGLDIAKVSDMSALTLVFTREGSPRKFHLIPYFWLPEAKVEELSDTLPVRDWQRNHLLTVTEGDAVDYSTIQRDIVALHNRFQIQRLAFDPWNAEAITQWLENEASIPRVEFRQTISNYAYPTSEFERLLKAGLLTHSGHPILDWQARHVNVWTDASGNFRPVKPKHADNRKIDGIVASIMGLSEAILAEAPCTGSPLIF